LRSRSRFIAPRIEMPCRFARPSLLRALGVIAAAWLAFGSTLMAQPASEPPPLVASRAALERIQATLKREGLSIHALVELEQSSHQLREALAAEISELEERTGEVEAQLKQLGAAPAPGAPPEGETLAAERARLNAEFGGLDAKLKEARLLAARAEELTAQITERRRSLYAQQLFVQSPSVLSPLVWRDAAKAFAEEIGLLGEWLSSEASALSTPDRLLRVAMAALTLVVLGIAVMALWRWWQRRVRPSVEPFPLPPPGDRPQRSFAKAVASFGAFLRIAITGPLAALAVVQVLEAYQLLSDRGYEIAIGVVTSRPKRRIAGSLPSMTARRRPWPVISSGGPEQRPGCSCSSSFTECWTPPRCSPSSPSCCSRWRSAPCCCTCWSARPPPGRWRRQRTRLRPRAGCAPSAGWSWQ
jgi:Protein of unknown function (DUF3772)